MALSSPDRAKLISVLGMLGSNFDGERAAAGLLASRMLREAGLSWADVIDTSALPPPREAAPSGWRTDLALAERHLSFCRPWEQAFVANLSTRATITPKQRAALNEISAALRARGKT